MSERAAKHARSFFRELAASRQDYVRLRPCPRWCSARLWRWALMCAIRFVYMGDE